jgi:hypothetical protein
MHHAQSLPSLDNNQAITPSDTQRECFYGSDASGLPDWSLLTKRCWIRTDRCETEFRINCESQVCFVTMKNSWATFRVLG